MMWSWPEPAKEEIISNFLSYLQRGDWSKGPDAHLGNPEINFLKISHFYQMKSAESTGCQI